MSPPGGAYDRGRGQVLRGDVRREMSVKDDGTARADRSMQVADGGRCMDRRAAIGGIGAATVAGITSLVLPSSSAAASPGATGAGTQTLQGFTVDDTGPASDGSDVTLIVRLFQAGGSAFTDPATVLLRVTVDDGSNGGVGGHPQGLTVDGETVVSTDPVVGRELIADDAGATSFSIVFPFAATYLVRISTTPNSLNNASGVTLVLTSA